MRQVAAKMQRRLSCTTDPIEEQHQFNNVPSPSRALSQHGNARLRRTSAQDSIDSAFSMLMGNNRRKGSDSNVGQIQPDLYRRRGSVISVGSNGTSGVLGRLQLQLAYDHSRSDLLIRLVQATLNCPIPPQLAGGCRIRISIQGQPLVKNRESESINFGEDGQWKAVDNGNGSINQFKLALGYSELGDAMLLVELMGAEKGGGQESPSRHALCLVPLGSLGPSADDLTVWADLERISETMARGELLVCLQYLPAAERLTLSVHQAANLRLANLSRGGTPTDLFIRAQLVGPDEKVLKRRKSGSRKAVAGDSIIVWDEVIGFDKVEAFSLARCHLDIQLVGSDRFGRAERPLGQIIFGPSKFGGLPPSNGPRLWPPDAGRWNVPRWIPLDPIIDGGNTSSVSADGQQSAECK